jgi:hypothetical protein
VSGAPLPQYHEQRKEVIDAWEAAGTAVGAHVMLNGDGNANT